MDVVGEYRILGIIRENTRRAENSIYTAQTCVIRVDGLPITKKIATVTSRQLSYYFPILNPPYFHILL